MKITSLEDVVCTAIAWFPFLAVLVAISVVLYGGVGQLEARTNGSSYVVANADSQGTHLHPADVYMGS